MMQECKNIPVVNGSVRYFPDFLEADVADNYFDRLMRHINWRQPVVRIFGKAMPSPRLSAWYADDGMNYIYSGYEEKLQPWLPALLEVKEKIEEVIRHPLNGVLANLYRDGNDSVGWHSDDEPELGPNPVIASVSLGAQRNFKMRPRKKHQGDSIQIELSHGSLLLMTGETQHYWLHSIPKSRGFVEPRINLTFRHIIAGSN